MCYLDHPVYGILLQQPELTNTFQRKSTKYQKYSEGGVTVERQRKRLTKVVSLHIFLKIFLSFSSKNQLMLLYVREFIVLKNGNILIYTFLDTLYTLYEIQTTSGSIKTYLLLFSLTKCNSIALNFN